MRYLFKLIGCLALGTLLNLLVALIVGVNKNQAEWWQLGLFIIAWIIVEGIYSLNLNNTTEDKNDNTRIN